MANKFYAVRKGAHPGIYATWAECEAQVHGISGAEYKAFKSEPEARDWLGEGYTQTPSPYPASASKPEASTYSADRTGDLQPGKAREGDVEAPPAPSAQARAPLPESSLPDAPGTDLRQQLTEKSAAFLAHLQEHGFSAYAASGGSQHHERIGIEGVGWVDLYHTRKKPFNLIPGRFEDPSLRDSVVSLWRAFHLGGAWQDKEPVRSSWDTVDHYYRLLRPYATLRFDFVTLARALYNAAPEAPDPDVVRYDFAQIENAYRRLRPQIS
jgi:hypothetical protein